MFTCIVAIAGLWKYKSEPIGMWLTSLTSKSQLYNKLIYDRTITEANI